MGESTLKLEVLKDYKTGTFVETGTADGEGVAVALNAGFEKVISLEVNPDVYVKACRRFMGDDRVLLVMGDSALHLPHVVSGLFEGKATFWLDSHWSKGECDLGPSVNKCPILHDLRAIAGSPIKDHIILVDDIRYFRSGGLPQWGGVTLGDIMEVVMEINPDYRISFRDGFVKDDVLV